LLQAAMSIPDWIAPKSSQVDMASLAPTATSLGLGLMGVHVEKTDQPVPFPGHLLAFEIISIHLVVVLVGAAYLARARRPRERSEIRGRG
jgi:NADH-quinone oxidoreductase subunit J